MNRQLKAKERFYTMVNSSSTKQKKSVNIVTHKPVHQNQKTKQCETCLSDTYLTALVASITSKLNQSNDYMIQRYMGAKRESVMAKDVFETILITARMQNRIHQSYYDQLMLGSDALDFDLEMYVLRDGTVLCEKLLSGVSVHTKQMLHDLSNSMKGSGWVPHADFYDDTYDGFVYFTMESTVCITDLQDVEKLEAVTRAVNAFVQSIQSFVDSWGTRTYRMQVSCDFNMRRMIRRAFHTSSKVNPGVPMLPLDLIVNRSTGEVRQLPLFCVDIVPKGVTTIQIQALYFEPKTRNSLPEYVIQMKVPVTDINTSTHVSEHLLNEPFCICYEGVGDGESPFVVIENNQTITNMSAWLSVITRSYPVIQSINSSMV